MAEPQETVRLRGAPNFRDVGGYPAADGRRVVYGRIYRSEMLVGLTPDDFALLDRIGIRAVFDMRSDPERARHPAPEPVRQRVRSWAMQTPAGDKVIDMRTLLADPATARAFMLDAHKAGIPAPIEAALGDIVRAVSSGETPCIIHCTFGKDRTGLAIAIILSLLGVSREHIHADYLISNRYRGTHEEMLASWFPRMTAEEMAEIPTASTDSLLIADTDYLDGMLDTAIANHGSIDDYAEQVLSVNGEMVERLRSSMLEPLA